MAWSSSTMPPVVVEQREQPPGDAHVALHARVLGVLGVHVVALFVGDHLEGELVVVAQEDAPLAAVGDVRASAPRISVIGSRCSRRTRHEHARHEREVEAHVALVAVAEVLDHVLGPLVRLGEQHPAGVLGVDLRAQPVAGTRGSRAGSRRWCRPARTGTARRRGGTRPGPGPASRRPRRAWPPGTSGLS